MSIKLGKNTKIKAKIQKKHEMPTFFAGLFITLLNVAIFIPGVLQNVPGLFFLFNFKPIMAV